jgi:hypothetical protein
MENKEFKSKPKHCGKDKRFKEFFKDKFHDDLSQIEECGYHKQFIKNENKRKSTKFLG